jgi:hypothetical protein
VCGGEAVLRDHAVQRLSGRRVQVACDDDAGSTTANARAAAAAAAPAAPAAMMPLLLLLLLQGLHPAADRLGEVEESIPHVHSWHQQSNQEFHMRMSFDRRETAVRSTQQQRDTTRRRSRHSPHLHLLRADLW